MNVRALIGVLVFGAGVALGAGSAWADQPALKFRGVGATRQALDGLQLKAFDSSLWSHLKDWSSPFNPEQAGGKVVMIVTWAGWRSQSHAAMRTAQSIATQFKDQDLVVIGVHNPRGFDQAAASAKELGVTFPFAADPDGKFRAGIKGDADPNVYFIDRAGQLRFAQVEPASAQAAAEMLLKETADDAKGILAGIAAKQREAEKAKFRTGEATSGLLVPPPRVEFQQPDDEAYKAVKWPYLVGKVEEDKILDKIYNTPPKLLVTEDDWVPTKPEWAGKLILMYAVDPLDSVLVNVLPVMNSYAIKYRNDVAVVGSTFKLGTDASVQGEELRKLVQRNTPAIQALIAANRINHPMWAQPARVEDTSNLLTRNTSGKGGFAVAVLASTDQKVRWVGNPYDRELVNRAIDALLEVDPGIKARRKAEANPNAGKPKE